jgi:nucleoside-diphosphate-sugar epimerase
MRRRGQVSAAGRLAGDAVLNHQGARRDPGAAAAPSALRTVVLRPPFVWGKGDAVDRQLGTAIRRGRFGWLGVGRCPYATCQVASLTEAVVRALHVQASGEAFFVTDGDPVELRSFLSRRGFAAGLPVPRTSVPTGAAWAMAGAVELAWRTLRLKAVPPLVRETVRLMGYPSAVDIGSARRRLGYAPVIGMDEGL